MDMMKEEVAQRCLQLLHTRAVFNLFEEHRQSNVIIQASCLRKTYPMGSCSCDRLLHSQAFSSQLHQRKEEASHKKHKEEVKNKAYCIQDSLRTQVGVPLIQLETQELLQGSIS